MATGFPYEDIVYLPPHISKKYPQATYADRAARFSPFAAITGYEDMVIEEARVTEVRIELDESAQRKLDETLNSLMCLPSEERKVRITHFVKDSKKEGGAYVNTVGVVKRIKEYERLMILRDGTRIWMEDIGGIELLE